MSSSWGKCAECGKSGDVYPASHYDETTHHYTARYVCRKCLAWELDLPPRHQTSFEEPDNAA